MRGDVVDVLLELAVHRGAKAASPCLSLPKMFHDGIGMGAGLTAVGRLVVLIHRVRPPEALVTVRAGVFSRSLVEFLLVSLPVELPLECLIAGCAPKFCIGGWGRRRRYGASSRGRGKYAVAT